MAACTSAPAWRAREPNARASPCGPLHGPSGGIGTANSRSASIAPWLEPIALAARSNACRPRWPPARRRSCAELDAEPVVDRAPQEIGRVAGSTTRPPANHIPSVCSRSQSSEAGVAAVVLDADVGRRLLVVLGAGHGRYPLEVGGRARLDAAAGLETRTPRWRAARAVLALLGRIPGDDVLPRLPPGTARVGEAAPRRLLLMLCGCTISRLIFAVK